MFSYYIFFNYYFFTNSIYKHDIGIRYQIFVIFCPLQTGSDGKEFKLDDPFAAELPAKGFDPGEDTFQVCKNLIVFENFYAQIFY